MAKQADKADEVVKGKEDKQQPSTPARGNSFSTVPPGRGWLYGLGAVVIVAIVFAAGVGVANHRSQEVFVRTGNMMGEPGGGFGFGHRAYGERFYGGGTSTSGQTRVAGVVTAVNGSNFTVAGHGSTTNVTTNSSTQYQDGSSQLKQNDSVIIFGTESNGTITADQIIVNPGGGGAI